MATQEPIRSTDNSHAAESNSAAGVIASVADEAQPKKSSSAAGTSSVTKVVSGRVSIEEFALVEEAAQRREMKRSSLVALAVLQFIGKAHAGARKVQVEVPDDVRREVRSAQETMDRLTVETRRVGRNLLVQLRKHWAGEPAAIEEIERASSALLQMQSELDRVAGDLRTVMDRSQW